MHIYIYVYTQIQTRWRICVLNSKLCCTCVPLQKGSLQKTMIKTCLKRCPKPQRYIIYIYMHIYIYIIDYIYTFLFLRVYLYLYLSLSLSIYIYIYTLQSCPHSVAMSTGSAQDLSRVPVTPQMPLTAQNLSRIPVTPEMPLTYVFLMVSLIS